MTTLSPEADQFLAEAAQGFNAAQRALEEHWNFSTYVRWGYDPNTGVLETHYRDGSTLRAEGQLLGTYSVEGKSFEWAWNSPHFKRAPIASDSRRVREAGKALGIRYLDEGMIPVPSEVALSYLCGIGLKVTGAQGVF